MRNLAEWSVEFFKGLRYMTFGDWAWLVAKLMTGILAPLTVFVSVPMAVSTGLLQMGTFYSVMALMALGGLLCATGLLLRGTRLRPMIVGYAFELAGLIPLMSAPFMLAAIYLMIAMASGKTATLLGASFCFALTSLIFARFADILSLRLATKEPEERGHYRTGV